ncbi:MAG: pyrroline-5-carboxylate reductase [Frankiaceae bacterium]|nr:pyrroline-5-carboxylate reductase [Frankiaceae bacterium]MBV9869806.1 pyrroline-5-carboxylate reductase [Frankiaceae bacterium]
MSEIVAVLGAGKMGEALLSGLLRAGRASSDLLFTERHEDRATDLSDRLGIESVSAQDAVARADTLLVAVKPQEIGALLDDISPVVSPQNLVISIVAGVPTTAFEKHLAERTPVVRVMSNTPVFVDEAMSAIAAGAHADESHLERTEALLSPVGKVIRVPEYQLDAVTALSGSGPAYFFFLVEAMIDAGILLGLPRAVAADLIVQTAIGSAVMLRDSGQHPVQLREAVTSPGGTTIAAIRELENHGVRAALLAALEAARNRSQELAAGAG